MKIAVSATEGTAESHIDDRFGRCKCFMVYELESGSWQVIDNEANSSPEHGAGIDAAQRLINGSVEAVVTGNCGPKAKKILDAAGIQVYLRQNGTVAEAIECYTKSELEVVP